MKFISEIFVVLESVFGLKIKIKYRVQNNNKITNINAWYNSRESNLLVRRLCNEKYSEMSHMIAIQPTMPVKENNIVAPKIDFIFLYSSQFFLTFFTTNHFLSSIHGSLSICSSDFQSLFFFDLKIEYAAIIMIVKKMIISIINSISILHHQISTDIIQNSHISKWMIT